jgi:hypothetical protein
MSVQPGLCGRCEHGRAIVSGKGTTFWLCRRSQTDPAYPRYPVLPVVRCAGFEPGTATAPDPTAPQSSQLPRTS